MKPEYDFSKAERGKFFHPEAVAKLPIYLDEDVDASVRQLAERSGQDVERLINDMLRNNVRLIHSVEQTGSTS